MSDASQDWTSKVEFARAHGLVEASFSADGKLTAFKLGPTPVAEDDSRSTQQRFPTEEELLRDRAERRRVALRSSGGPVKRLGDLG